MDDRGCGMKVCSDSVLLAAWFATVVSPVESIIDVGAGSGVISLLIADAWPQVSVTALELEPAACQAAADNFKASPWENRITLVPGNFLDYVPAQPVGALISNPPYFENGLTAPDLTRASSRHQADLNYDSLMKYSARVLTSDGVIGLVTPVEAEESVMLAGTLAGLHLHFICRVRTAVGKPPRRLLWLWGRAPEKSVEQEISIRDASGYTPEYRRLVEPFYHHLK